MGTLEKIAQMKEQGLSEYQIIDSLKKQGVSPKDINEGLNQLKIKDAIASEEQANEGYDDGSGNMQPSISSQDYSNANFPPQTPYPDNMQNYPRPEQEYPAMASPNQQYGQYYAPYSQQGSDIDTINDIAEQIFEEKASEIKKKVSEVSRFQEDATYAIQKIEERLTKLENTFNEMQMAILKKIGDYGEDIKDISKEMKTTQETFSKIVAPMTKNISELKEIAGERHKK